MDQSLAQEWTKLKYKYFKVETKIGRSNESKAPQEAYQKPEPAVFPEVTEIFFLSVRNLITLESSSNRPHGRPLQCLQYLIQWFVYNNL